MSTSLNPYGQGSDLATSYDAEVKGELTTDQARAQRTQYLAEKDKLAKRLLYSRTTDPAQAKADGDRVNALQRRVDELDELIKVGVSGSGRTAAQQSEIDATAAQGGADSQQAAADAAAAQAKAGGQTAVPATGNDAVDEKVSFDLGAAAAMTGSDILATRPSLSRSDVQYLFQGGGSLDDLMSGLDAHETNIAKYDAAITTGLQAQGAGFADAKFTSPRDLGAGDVYYDQGSTSLATGRPGGVSDAEMFLADPTGYSQARAQTGRLSLRAVLAMPAQKTEAEIISLQNLLVKAGYIDPNVVVNKGLVWGDATDAYTAKGWRDAIRDSYSDPSRSLVQLLNDRAAKFGPAVAQKLLEGDGSGRKYTLSLSDPSALRLASDQIGQRLLGRKLSPVEQAKLVDTVHGYERTEATDQMDGVSTQVDPQARLEEAIRSNLGAEADAHEVAGQFSQFRRLITGSV